MSNTARNTKNNNFYVHNNQNMNNTGGAQFQHIFAKSQTPKPSKAVNHSYMPSG